MALHVMDEANKCLQCKVPQCRKGCPINTNIPEAIRLLRENKLNEAGKMLFFNNPLTTVCSLVCNHENQCEGHCVLGRKGSPVHFSTIEQYISTTYANQMVEGPKPSNGIKVAIVGSGLAGLTIAVILARYGYDVTIFEIKEKIGGVLRYGIPEFRLPKSVLDDFEYRHLRLKGIKGVLGANATGYITGVMSAVLGKGPANIFTADPHTFGDLFWGMVINYYLLFFSGQIKLDCLNSAKRIYDNWGEEDKLTAEDFQIEFRDLSLESCADELIPLNSGGDTDEVFTIANNDVLLSGGNLKNVDAYTYPDNQAQFVAANNYTALFRILADGDRTHLVYQYQNPDTGEILPEVYKVRLPEDMSVTAYVAVPNKYQAVDQNLSNYVYIGAVLADN